MLIAAVAAACVFPLVGLVHALGVSKRWWRLTAAIAGGWSAIAAFEAIYGDAGPYTDLVPLIAATAAGQLGAWWGANRAWQLNAGFIPPANAKTHIRISLRTALGLTAWVAILSALLGWLNLSPRRMLLIATAVAVQIGATTAITIWNRRRNRMVAVRQGVSRETTAATNPT